MVRCRRSIADILPALFIIVMIGVITLFCVFGILGLWWQDDAIDANLNWFHGIKQTFTSICEQINSAYFISIFYFTVKQSFLSMLISIVFGFIFAKCLFYVPKSLQIGISKLLLLMFIIPPMIVVMGLIAIYGKSGLLSQLLYWLKWDYNVSLYGLNGIVFAHVMMNFPYCARLIYEQLRAIPNEQIKLSKQLRLNGWQTFRLVEWTNIKNVIYSLAAMVFLICFSSFAIILALGGGPKSTTLTVAIISAIRDFDIELILLYSFVQIVMSIAIVIMYKRTHAHQSIKIDLIQSNWRTKRNRWVVYLSNTIILLFILMILTPLLAILVESSLNFSGHFLSSDLLNAIIYSLLIAISSASLSVLSALLIIWANGYCYRKRIKIVPNLTMIASAVILIIPSIVLGSGIFLFFYQYHFNLYFEFSLIVMINVMTSLPIILFYNEANGVNVINQFMPLAQSISMNRWQFIHIIFLPLTKNIWKLSFFLTMILSLGDLSVIVLFGNNGFQTLPYYIYDLLSHYRLAEANFITALLLLLSIILILFTGHSNERHRR